MSSSNPDIRFVESGACYLYDGFLRCALTADECQKAHDQHGVDWLVTQGEQVHFRSARQLRLLVDNNNYNNPCDAVQELAVGLCTSDNDRGVCTGDPSNCVVPSNYEDLADDCTVARKQGSGDDEEQPSHNSDAVSTLALYGLCKSRDTNNSAAASSRCVWSSSDCPGIGATHDYFPAVANARRDGMHELCTCDSTLVGACVGNGDYTCAVDAGACDEDTDFVSAWELLERDGAPQCFLCQPFEHEEETAAAAPTVMPTTVPPMEPTGDPPTTTTTTTLSEPTAQPSNRIVVTPVDSVNNNNDGVAIEAAVGASVALAVILLILVVVVIRRQRRAASNQEDKVWKDIDKEEEANNPPPPAVMAESAEIL